MKSDYEITLFHKTGTEIYYSPLFNFESFIESLLIVFDVKSALAGWQSVVNPINHARRI